MQHLQSFGCALLLAVLLPACSLLGGGEETRGEIDGVSVTASPPELVITNHSSEDIYTFVVGRQAAALVNWAAGVHGGGLPPGGSERVRYEDVSRQGDEKEAIVYWWRAIMKDGTRVPGQIHPIIVEL